MPALWKPLLVVAALAAVARATDPPKPYQLPLTPFEILAVVHTETSDDAVIRKLKESGTRFAPGAPELRQLRQLGVSDKVLIAVTTEQPQVSQVLPLKMGRQVGTWVREVGDLRIVMKFTEDRLTLTANVPGPDGDEVVMTADADYSVNPEGLMFGVISGIDADIAEAATELQMLTGHTFSARCRIDGTTMTVKDLKAFGSGLKMNGEQDDFTAAMQMACGRYTRDDTAKPTAPRKAKPQQKIGGSGSWNRDAPQPILPNPPPIAYAPPPTAVAPVMQPVPPMMAPPPPPLPGNVVQAGWTVYPNPPPMSPVPPMMTPPAPPSKLVGSWVREMDGMQLIAKFTEKRAFLTASIAFLNEKQEQRMTVRLEADYAIGPDGTVFGVITSTDFMPQKGIALDDAMSELLGLARMNGSPFCFRFRLDEGNLNIRDLRCGELAGCDFAARNPQAMMMLGRYKPLGNQDPTPPKPVQIKMSESGPSSSPVSSRGIEPTASFERIGVDFGINSGGTGGTMQPYPQYFPPDPAFPPQREAAPAPRAVRR